MRELVIVIADLHLPSDQASARPEGPPGAGAGCSPGIEHVARFGSPAPLAEGWRGWVARWLGLAEYANHPAASVAAVSADVPAGRACWLATALHLVEGLTRVHVDWSCLLRLPRQELDRLAVDFREAFRGSGFDLAGLESGEFLLTAPPLAPIRTIEPVRVPQVSIAEALPSGEGAAALRRLGTEIEMWLHAHPLNSERVRRGERPVSTLWIWGGGEPPVQATAAPVPAVDVFASDAYVRGLCRLAGLQCSALAPEGSVANDATVPRALCVLEALESLRTHDETSLPAALAQLDHRVIAPAVDAVRRGRIQRLVLLANDRSWTLRPADALKFWRRRRRALEALA